MIRQYLTCALLFFVIGMCAQEDRGYREKVSPVQVGNLALPGSQRPYGLFSFGQSILKKCETIFYCYINDLHGCHKRLSDITPTLLYGVSDRFSLSINCPIALRFKEDGCCSSGIQDMAITGQYGFGNRQSLRSVGGASIVGTLYLPTGSTNKKPATGLGSPSFFTGVSVGHLSVDWYFFLSQGILFTTRHHAKKPGNRYLYQGGFGGNIKSPPGWIYAWIVEFLGTQTGPDKVCGVTDCTTGSSVISLAPQLWVSSDCFILQAGIAVPIHQRRPPMANKDRYLLTGCLRWKF